MINGYTWDGTLELDTLVSGPGGESAVYSKWITMTNGYILDELGEYEGKECPKES